MSLTELPVKFKEIERTVQGKCFEIGRAALKSVLEDWDKDLMSSRDKSEYRHVGKKTTTIKTVLGEVTYGRAQYEHIDGEGRKGYVFLLDEAVGIRGTGHYSGLMAETIVQACCNGAYREAARTVSEMTGQTVSHTAAWNVAQAAGAEAVKEEKRNAALAAKGKGAGTIEAELLFEEQDGVSLSLQGEDRKKHGRRKEMKLAIAYDGYARKNGRYALTNKVAYAGFGEAGDFQKLKEGAVASVYNTDEITMRLLGGDGAKWVRQAQTDETVHFQLDIYHRNKAVTEHVRDPKARGMIMGLLNSEDIDLLLHVIETEALSADDEKAREGYVKLHAYFQNNRDGLVPWQCRGLGVPEPPEGKEYRRMGAMESNIFTIIGNRMKGRRRNWSIAGGGNLARLLCLKHTGKLRGMLDSLSASALPERYAEEAVTVLSAAKSPPSEGKGYDGFHQAMIPSAQKWLKDLASIKPVYSF